MEDSIAGSGPLNHLFGRIWRLSPQALKKHFSPTTFAPLQVGLKQVPSIAQVGVEKFGGACNCAIC